MKKEKKRLFISIELPNSVLAEAKRIQKELKKSNLFEGRYIVLKQMHITPKFMGEVYVDQIGSIQKTLQSIVFKPCHAQLDGIGIFGDGNKIKIIYLSICAPELVQFAYTLNTVLEPWSQQEKRAFVSHITLARIKKTIDNKKGHDLLRNIQVKPIKFIIDKFALKESKLMPEEVVYTTLQEYSLK